MPLREAVWVPESSTMMKVPVRVPEAVGMNAMATVQPVLGASAEPQVLAVILKLPLTDGVWSDAGVPPVFEMVMFCTALVALIGVDGKARVMGFRMMAAGGVPVPMSVAVAWPPATLP